MPRPYKIGESVWELMSSPAILLARSKRRIMQILIKDKDCGRAQDSLPKSNGSEIRADSMREEALPKNERYEEINANY
jgi:hypothetical protein